MFNKKPLQWFAFLLIVLTLLACSLFSTPNPTPEPIQAADTFAGTLTPTPIPPTAQSTRIPSTPTDEPILPEEIFDGRIGISVAEVEIARDLPDDYGLPTSSNDAMYASIHLTVTQIEQVHITELGGYEKENSILYDDEGQSYDLVYSTFSGIRFLNPNDIRSPYEFIEGANGVLIYEIPEDREPATLDLIYTYQENWDDDSSKKRGEMTIALGEGSAGSPPLPQYGSDWQPIQFTLPSKNNYWTRSPDNSYTAKGSQDTFAWAEETYEGNLLLSFEMEIIFYENGQAGGGCIIVFGNGIDWSQGTLVFCVDGEYQRIQTDTVYEGTEFLDYSEVSLDENHMYTFTIEILDDSASLYLDGKKIVSTALPMRINRSGKIGLYKYSEIPEVTFYKVRFMKIE
jgi:hypothetical protein